MRDSSHFAHLSGFLYELCVLEPPALFLGVDLLPGLRSKETAHEPSGLPLFEFTSSTALLGEDSFGILPPYRYPIVIWDVGWGVGVFSTQKRIVEALDNTLIAQLASKKIVKTSPRAQAVVKHVLDRRADLTLNFVHAQRRRFVHALGAVSYWGTDLRKSRRFKADLPEVNAKTARVTYLASGEVLLTIGADGYLSLGSSSLSGAKDFLDESVKEGLIEFAGPK